MRTEDEGPGTGRNSRWWIWVVVVVIFFVGFALGRTDTSSDADDVILLAASNFDELATTIEKAAEIQYTEQEAYRLWINVMESEIRALHDLQAEFPSVEDELDGAISMAQTARNQAVISADLSEKYWETSKMDAGRLRNLAERLRKFAD